MTEADREAEIKQTHAKVWKLQWYDCRAADLSWSQSLC